MRMPAASCLHSSINGCRNEDMCQGDLGPGIIVIGMIFRRCTHSVGGKLKFSAMSGQQVGEPLWPCLKIQNPSVKIPNATSHGSLKNLCLRKNTSTMTQYERSC